MVVDIARCAGAGTLAAVPPVVHQTFAHLGACYERFLNVHAPDGGFAAYLRKISN